MDLARRRVFSAPVTWVRPPGRQKALLIAGSVLMFASLALPIGDLVGWEYGNARFLAVPVVAVALAMLAATADLRVAGAVAAEARLPAVAALAYLAPTTLAAGYLAGSAASPFGLALGVGAVCLGVPAVTRVRPRPAPAT